MNPAHEPELRVPVSARHVRKCLHALQTAVRDLKGIGPKRGEQLEAFGLRTVEDILYHLPFRYDDRRQIKSVQEAIPGKVESFVGELAGLTKRYNPRRRSQVMSAQLIHQGAVLELFWYRAPAYLASSLGNGQKLLVHGRVERGQAGRKRIVHPEFEVLSGDETSAVEKILPVYVRPAGLPLSLLRKWIAHALDDYCDYIPNALPPEVGRRRDLLTLAHAIRQLHQPESDADMSRLTGLSSVAHRTLVFEELFYLQSMRLRYPVPRYRSLIRRELFHNGSCIMPEADQ